MAGFFIASLLLLRSFDMAGLRVGAGGISACIPSWYCTPVYRKCIQNSAVTAGQGVLFLTVSKAHGEIDH